MSFPEQHGRKSGGQRVEHDVPKQNSASSEEVTNYQTAPPEEQRLPRSPEGLPGLVKTIIVHDEQGQVVSVTKVAPDAKFGVGVKLKPGHTVKEFEAGSLASDPFEK